MANLFGADGIRGTIDEYPLRQADLIRLGGVIAAWLLEFSSSPAVLLGIDTRESSQRIKYDLIHGLTRGGIKVIDSGILPTAGLSYLIASKGTFDGGIMITASHNPLSENGIKIFNHKGIKIKEEDEILLSTLFNSGNNPPFRVRPGELQVAENYITDYIDSLVVEFDNMAWDRGKIIVDCANGATEKVVKATSRKLNLPVILYNANPTGVNINVNAGSEYIRCTPAAFIADLHKYDAELGIALDGDGDRAVMIDSSGAFFDGDSLLAIFALYLQATQALAKDTIVTTPMSNSGLETLMTEKGIKLEKVRNGDKYITDKLIENEFVLGGEPIGHIILHDNSTHVTGDGVRTMLKILQLLSATSGSRLGELTGGLIKWPQINVSVHLGYRTAIQVLDVPQLAAHIAKVKEAIPDLTQFQCRPASTEPVYRIMMEARETPTSVLAFHANQLARHIQSELSSLDYPVQILDCTCGGIIKTDLFSYGV